MVAYLVRTSFAFVVTSSIEIVTRFESDLESSFWEREDTSCNGKKWNNVELHVETQKVFFCGG